MNSTSFCRTSRWLILLLVLAWLAAHAVAQTRPDAAWPNYGNDPGGARYSPLTQVDRSNVAQLKVAWTYHTGALGQPSELNKKATFETTPIFVAGKLFLTTPYNHVIALDPVTGAKIWEFDPHISTSHDYSEVSSRGVASWLDAKARPDEPCRLRIFLGTLDARLIALDGQTGERCAKFGTGGEIDLKADADVPAEWGGGYQVTSAPAISAGLVIVGSSIADNWRVNTGRGIVRAYDARTGRLSWSWDPIPWALDTKPRTGAGNAWSTLSVDAGHDLVFIPTGSASPDYFGGIRKGDNKWANSVVALTASTGKFVWGFQVVHHDLWDYDVASQPTLFTWKDGTPAVVINTKMGHVFVLNRLNGKPLLPVEERPVPKSDVEGEESSATQPFSTISLVPETLDPAALFGKTPQDKLWCQEKLKSFRYEGVFTPPSLAGTLVYPSNVGGVNWGSAAYDPERHIMIANTNRLIAWTKLIPRAQFEEQSGAPQDNRIYGEFAGQTPSPYGLYRSFLFSPGGTPCNAPPWGTTEAVDLFTGKKVWDTALGSFVPGAQTGTINLGGPIITAGGLVFTAASMDNYIRAFDSGSGTELWKFELPAGGQATPMTYSVHGKQYVVIAAGGHGKLNTKQGDAVVAFTLP
ncbi:MAG TPA: pyrroloquinoline quinone-dependent dehydrogenase [Candidatus Saccharimonadales bacterium]|nr:pyrroloquinoline quinone-dependent dehydrogenase [Candidatus Saccharimonadales bacterium]